MKSALESDRDGSWSAAFAACLRVLSKCAEASATALGNEDLRQRCRALACGAALGAQVLPALHARLGQGSSNPGSTPAAAEAGLALAARTSTLYELGWLAVESGLEAEGLDIVQSIGMLLHGRTGGFIFRVESLLAIGRPAEAVRVWNEGFALDDDPSGLAAVLLAALLMQRAAGRRGSTGNPARRTE